MIGVRPHTQTERARLGARVAALALTLVLLMLPAASARADVGATIIERCTQGKSIGGYTQQDYRRALQELPTEVEEYSDCANKIRRAQLAAAGGGAGAGPAGGASVAPIPLTPAEQRGIAAISHHPAPPLRIGNQLIRPGVVHAGISSAFSSLPNALLALLALLAASALALAGRTIRNRVWKRSAS
jgi:hypothetical protein